MAATTTKRFLLRHHCNIHPFLRPNSYHFSSSYDPDIPQPQPQTQTQTQTQPSFPTNFKEVKAILQKEQQKNCLQIPRKSVSFSNPTATQTPASLIASLEEIRNDISEFRLRSSASPQSSVPGQFVTFKELYKRNVVPSSDNSAPNSDFASKSPADVIQNMLAVMATTPAGPAGGKHPFDAIRESLDNLRATNPAVKNRNAAGGNHPFDAIRESIHHLRTTTPAVKNRDASAGNPIDPMSLASFTDSLKLRPADDVVDSPAIIGGNGILPSQVFVKKKGTGDNLGRGATRTELMKFYDYQELGKKLEMLRPEKKGKWFSLQELNERLVKLREMEEESAGSIGGVTFKDLRASLLNLKQSDYEKERNNTMQRLDVLGQISGTQSIVHSPPKEYLVEKYSHPDNMSSAEKLKLELKKVRDEFKMSESDCGSARVQVAQLTTKIKHLSTVLQKKDKHSRMGLQAMVQKRKKLLNYLRRTDWDSYTVVLSKLGLRDNPVVKT